MSGHPFNLVCIDIRCCHLNRCRQIEDDWILHSRLPYFLDCLTDIQRKIKLCTCKALRRILKLDIAVKAFHILLHHLRTINCNLLDLFTIHIKDHISLQGGCGIVNMDNDILASLNSLKCSLDQMLSALDQDLNLDIIRNQISLNQCSQKIIFNLRSCRETDFDFLESQFHKQIEKFNLLFNNHWLDQCLIAVSQIDTAPDRCLLDLFVRPLSLRIMNYRYSLISLII